MNFPSSLAADRWVLRVFVPLRATIDADGPVTGYFEGVRVIPEWRKKFIFYNSLGAAFLVAVASLICGPVIYPVVVHLSTENERKTREVLDSHISMMEALGRAIALRDSDTGVQCTITAWPGLRRASARRKASPAGPCSR